MTLSPRATARSRGRDTPARLLRQTDGDQYAVTEALLVSSPDVGPSELPEELGGAFVVQLEFDDGNGVWISQA